MSTVTLPLDRVQVIVEHLVNDGSREGLILGDELNVAMGASARRRAERQAPVTAPLEPGYPRPADCHPGCVAYSMDVRLAANSDHRLVVECDYCGTVVATFTEAERTIAERVATEHGGYHH